MQLAGGDFNGDDAPALAFDHDQVKHVELIEERHPPLDALLVERLQDHVARAVGRVAGAHHGDAGAGVGGAGRGGLVVVGIRLGVAPEPALGDPAVGRPVEREAHVLQLVDALDGLLAEDLGRRLVDEEVAPLDRVVGVVLPRVVLEVRQGRGDPPLRGPGVGSRRVELAHDRRPDVQTRLERGHHPGATGPDDDAIEPVVIHGKCSLGDRSGAGGLVSGPGLPPGPSGPGRRPSRRAPASTASGRPSPSGTSGWHTSRCRSGTSPPPRSGCGGSPASRA